MVEPLLFNLIALAGLVGVGVPLLLIVRLRSDHGAGMLALALAEGATAAAHAMFGKVFARSARTAGAW